MKVINNNHNELPAKNGAYNGTVNDAANRNYAMLLRALALLFAAGWGIMPPFVIALLTGFCTDPNLKCFKAAIDRCVQEGLIVMEKGKGVILTAQGRRVLPLIRRLPPDHARYHEVLVKVIANGIATPDDNVRAILELLADGKARREDDILAESGCTHADLKAFIKKIIKLKIAVKTKGGGVEMKRSWALPFDGP